MVKKIHPQGLIWVSPGLVTCQKKNDDLAVQYEDVHGLMYNETLFYYVGITLIWCEEHR